MNKHPILHCNPCGGPRPHTYTEEHELKNGLGETTGYEQIFVCDTCKVKRAYGRTVAPCEWAKVVRGNRRRTRAR